MQHNKNFITLNSTSFCGFVPAELNGGCDLWSASRSLSPALSPMPFQTYQNPCLCFGPSRRRRGPLFRWVHYFGGPIYLGPYFGHHYFGISLFYYFGHHYFGHHYFGHPYFGGHQYLGPLFLGGPSQDFSEGRGNSSRGMVDGGRGVSSQQLVSS